MACSGDDVRGSASYVSFRPSTTGREGIGMSIESSDDRLGGVLYRIAPLAGVASCRR